MTIKKRKYERPRITELHPMGSPKLGREKDVRGVPLRKGSILGVSGGKWGDWGVYGSKTDVYGKKTPPPRIGPADKENGEWRYYKTLRGAVKAKDRIERAEIRDLVKGCSGGVCVSRRQRRRAEEEYINRYEDDDVELPSEDILRMRILRSKRHIREELRRRRR
jgi:hypothetical protein